MTSASTSPQERLFNLVIGLASTRKPVTRAQIYENFVGYKESASQTAFERLFERDKETLRRLGVPLITAPLSTFDDEVGYLIDASSYALPPVELSPEQARIATLAATLWRDSAMQDAAARGVTKLRAIGASMDGLTPPALDIDPGATTPSFAALLDAIQVRREVHFTYRAASSGEESKRRVQPWRIKGRRGAWYLTGFDLDRNDRRVFRLDRIVGNVRARGPERAFDIPEGEIENGAQLGGSAVVGPREARIVVAAGRANALRLRAERVEPAPGDVWDGDGAAEILTIALHEVNELARAIAGLGEHALVLEPADLRDRVIALLRGAAGLSAERAEDQDEGGHNDEETQGSGRDQSAARCSAT